MTDESNDDGLAAEFIRLRDEETRGAPPFREPSEAHRRPAKLRGFLEPGLVAVALLLVVIVALIFIVPSAEESTIDTVAEWSPDQEALHVSALEMPTDFLLDTPGIELATATPHFQLTTPSYATLEER